MEGLPTTLLGWTQSTALILVGAFSLVSLFDKTLNGRRRLAQEVDNELITSLKTSIDHLKERQRETTAELEAAKSRITVLEAENKLLKDIATGQDAATQSFQTDAYEAMKKVVENVTISRLNHEAIVAMGKNIESLAKNMEKLIDHLPVVNSN